MRRIQDVFRKALIQNAVVVIVVAFIMTNVGFTWLFSQYISDMRANERSLVLGDVNEVMGDGRLLSDEQILLRQISNQSGVHLRVYTGDNKLIFDSSVAGNGNHRPILSRQKKVVDQSQLAYKKYAIESNSGNFYCEIGQQKGWLVNAEDIAFLIGVDVVFGLTLIFAVPLIWFSSRRMARKISEPIVSVKKMTDKIASGEYGSVMHIEVETEELNSLSKTIESLSNKLSAQEALRKRLTADIAHELRSPLAVVRSQLEGISDGVIEGTPERLARLVGEIVRLTKLIGDLSELNAVENELYAMQMQTVDLSKFTMDIAMDYEAIFESKGLKLSVEIDSQLLMNIDAARYKQIIVNLLSNALKYTEQGFVTLKLTKEKTQIHLSVTDTGIGIAKEHLPYIFERFYRVDPSRNRETGGAGIGLAIVKKLVDVLGGKIEATSELGVGTNIGIWLPIVHG